MSRNKDTTTRYSQLGKKLKNMPDLRDAMDPGLILFISLCTFLHFYPDFSDTRVSKDLMEHRFGRESVLDGITSLRSLMSKLLAFAHAPAPLFQIFNFLGYLINWDGPPKSLWGLNVPACDLVYIVRIRLLEKAVGLRKALTQHRTGVQRYDLGTCLNWPFGPKFAISCQTFVWAVSQARCSRRSWWDETTSHTWREFFQKCLTTWRTMALLLGSLRHTVWMSLATAWATRPPWTTMRMKMQPRKLLTVKSLLHLATVAWSHWHSYACLEWMCWVPKVQPSRNQCN